MTPATALRLLALFWALLFFAVPAHANESTAAALDLLCPGHQDLREPVDAAARRHLLHPVLIVSLMHVESRCRAGAVSSKGALGLLQVLPRGPAANGRTRAQLLDPRENIATGSRWLAMLTVWCGGLPAGLGAYNSGSCTKSHRFARHVLAVVARVWRELRMTRERTS